MCFCVCPVLLNCAVEWFVCDVLCDVAWFAFVVLLLLLCVFSVNRLVRFVCDCPCDVLWLVVVLCFVVVECSLGGG